MKTWKYLVLALALGAGPAQSQDSSVAVRLDFDGAAVAAGAVRRVSYPAPSVYGNPEEQPLWVEVLDAQGGVTYAAVVIDPRAGCNGGEGSTLQAPPKGSVEVVVPAADAAALVLYRRASDEGRTELVRVSL